MTSAENSISEAPNLKFSGGGYSQIPLQGLCTRDNVPLPVTKNLATALLPGTQAHK